MYLVASLFIGIPFALVNGIWPKSITGWIIVIIFALPTMLLGELLGEKLFSNKISQGIDKNRKDKIISVRRIGYALIMGIITTAAIVLFGYLLRDSVGAHFSIQ